MIDVTKINRDVYIPPQIVNIFHACEKYDFLRIGEDGVLEIYADNHMLSSLRQCEGYFTEGILNRLGGKGRAWSLEFGLFIHECLEKFYHAHNKQWQGYSLTQWLLDAEKLWKEMNFELDFQNDPRYKKIGGWPGTALLLAEYFTVYGNNIDRLRIVGCELGFGKSKEVPILSDHSLYPWAPFRAYYCGRLDYIVDNGAVLGPMDTKTTSRFDGTESNDFKPHEGMEGYVYSTQKLVPEDFAKQGRLPNTVIINHISLQPCKTPYDRFKRSFKAFTPEELEAWRLRQVRTFAKMYELVVEGRPADWNTQLCTQMYYHDCPYKAIHEVSPSSRKTVIDQFYTIRPAWSPYQQDETKKEA